MASDAGQLPIASLAEISRVLEETARILRHHAAIAEGLDVRPWDAEGQVTAAELRAIIAVRWMRRRFRICPIIGLDECKSAAYMPTRVYIPAFVFSLSPSGKLA